MNESQKQLFLEIQEKSLELNSLIKVNEDAFPQDMFETIKLHEQSCLFFQNIGEHYRVLYEINNARKLVDEFLGI